MSEFFFAWVGGAPLPAVTVATKGDIWGGSINVLGNVWGGELSTSGDFMGNGTWVDKSTACVNMQEVGGLVEGAQYLLSGNVSIPITSSSFPSLGNDFNRVIGSGAVVADSAARGSAATVLVVFTFDGANGGTVSPAVEPVENASFKLSSDVGLDQVFLQDTSQLTLGQIYAITGSGIPDNTTFLFDGNPFITISNPATRSGNDVELTISTADGQNVLTNIGDTSLLEIGETYQIFGNGIGPTTLGVFQSDGTMLLTEPATISNRQIFLRIHRGIVYPDGGNFDEGVHARKDERVLSVSIDHSEGNFPLLTIDLKNPHVGLLAEDRNVWCWLSWRENDAAPITPLFHGRLVAIPADIENEKITIVFMAEPTDYANRQAILITTLREPPYWDPIWLQNGVDNATSILEARTAEWHTDRVTLDVSISDIIIGEDGTLEIGANQPSGVRHIYRDLKIKNGNSPLAAVYVSGSVSFTQSATGTIDITDKMVQAFQESGSATSSPNISSYAGDGLLSSWPKPLTQIGGGWSIGLDNSIVEVTGIFRPLNMESRFTTKYPIAGTGSGIYVAQQWEGWATLFPLNIYAINFTVSYEAKRDWTEVVSFFLEADTQQIKTDSRSSVESFSLSSSLLQTAIDLGGLHPLEDDRYNTYFKTPRGQASFKFLLAYGKAKLIARARAVDIDFTIPWKAGLGLSCRWNVHITDPRIPGGAATGKVIAYRLLASPSEGMKANVTIGCTIGRGGSVAAVEGEGAYAAPGYMKKGYQATVGGTVDLGDSSITYQNFDDFVVVDDGLNFFTLDADSAVKRIQITGGVSQQRTAIAMVHSTVNKLGSSATINTIRSKNPPDPVGALQQCYTYVTLELVPVQGGGFISEFAVDVSKLQIPKTIDLEAPSV